MFGTQEAFGQGVWGGNSAVFEVNRRIKQGSGAVVWRCSLVQRDGKEQLQGAANIKS